MSDAQLIDHHDLVVALDYGQFSLRAVADDDDDDPDLDMTVLNQALEGDGIGQQGNLVVVTSPHQNNFEMPLRVEVWDGEPTDDAADWQEAFELHLEVGAEGLIYESPTLDIVRIDVPAGSYRALITGRGFVAHGWPGSTTPGDEWRIRLWPSRESLDPRRLRAFSVADAPPRPAAVPPPPPPLPSPSPSAAAAAGQPAVIPRGFFAARRMWPTLPPAPGRRPD